MQNQVELFQRILPKGLLTYKKIGSKASLPKRVAQTKIDVQTRQGVIFAVRHKAHFGQGRVKGYILTSIESLIEDAASLTHFTPNIYRYGTYTDCSRKYIKGFSEENLQQINTFVVDIDTKRYSVQDILLACIDDSIGLPTLIVQSDRGYQVYFVLETPLFITNKENFKGLRVAKRISENLKRSLKAVEADVYCNDFGFFRIPTENNIVYQGQNHTYDIATLINWSMRQDDHAERPLFVVPKKQSIMSVMQTEWFHQLVNTVNIQGEKGLLGRNNTIFTLALICYAEKWHPQRTADFLDEFNSRLQKPLKNYDVRTILQSAYSGKYKGPKKEYVEAILTLHVVGGAQFHVSFGNRNWYKFKKEREARVRSHYDEWETDLINYIQAEKATAEPFIWRTQKELCKAVGIAQSSLNVVIKQSKKIVKTVIGKGRAAKTGWTTVALFMTHMLKQIKNQKATYRTFTSQHVAQWMEQLAPVAGYDEVVRYVEIFLKESQNINSRGAPNIHTS